MKKKSKDDQNVETKDTLIEPDIIPIQYYDNSQQIQTFMIFDNFEILSKKKIEQIFGINVSKSNFIDINIFDGYTIINFPKDINGGKIISMIGIINNENLFKAKYILIFDKNEDRNSHLNKIKSDLNSYLTGFTLLNNSAPIINKKVKIVGIIVKLAENNFVIKDNNTQKDILLTDQKIIINNNDKEYCLDFHIDKPFIRINFISCPKIGLQNIGATCYMNATLQCFCHIEKFIDYFKYNSQIINIVIKDKNNLTSSFKLLIEKLWPNNYNNQNNQTNKNKYYPPEEFKKKISEMNPLFKGIAANDAKDLINFIIMILHEELNQAKKDNIDNNIIIDQTNKIQVFQLFAQSFTLNNQSIISDLFYSINCSITECGNCHTRIFNYQIFFLLCFL